MLGSLGACHTAPARVARGTPMADDGGDTVRVGVPARRIVSLVPAITEMLFAIGAGDAVVGRTTWCDYPAAALKVPSVGDGIDPNLEAVVARRPDLVLLYSSGQNVAAHERLADLGVPSLRLTTDHLADVPRLARLLGRVTGHELQGDSVARAFEAALAETSAPPGVHPLSVFFLAWTQPAMTVGRGSFLTELLARAGARNVFDDVAPSSAVVSIEAVAARNPDLILTLGADAPSLEGRPEWSAVGAVREGRLVHIEGTEFSWPGPRSPDAIRELRSALGNARAAHAATLSAEVGE